MHTYVSIYAYTHIYINIYIYNHQKYEEKTTDSANKARSVTL